MIKRCVALCALIFISLCTYADEGMWLPVLLKQLNITDMQSKGLKLSADDIYSVNKTSLKDAVVLFGGGCTGEIISDQGLLLTNHHCGYSSIAFLSSIDKDYLKNGFWATKKENEMPAPTITVTFIISIDDVTAKIIPYLNDSMSEQQRNLKILEISSKLERDAIAGTHYKAAVKPFYYGNEFYLFTTEVFTDIRLVGAPPNVVGDFGGETDNWMWPRHAADFSLFRIYANKDNKPADYAIDNVPYKPRYHLPISMAGVKEDDFAMVFGFPGTTQEYLPSYAVDLIQNVQDPNRVAIRDSRISIIEDAIHGNDTIRLSYAPKIKRLANAYKKWKGEMLGLKKNDAVVKKQKAEVDFTNWTATNANGKKYASLLPDFKTAYDKYRPLSKTIDYTNEAAYGIELINYALLFRKLVEMCETDTIPDSLITKEADRLLKNADSYFKNYRIAIDKKVFAALMKMYNDSVVKENQPAYLKNQVEKFKYDFNAFADNVYSNSFLASYGGVEKMLKNYKRKSYKKINSDAGFALAMAISVNYNEVVPAQALVINQKILQLQRKYIMAQREFQPNKKFYPDANSTLRIAYGNVKGYAPKDGVYYQWQTTLSGVMQKNIAGDDEFGLPAKLIELYEKKDFGRYAVNGDVPVAFITTTHTTGGNSGAPLINANGELAGINFDRVWEGTMSDIMFDPNRCRNISLDVRYILFLIDKFAGAKNIIDELDIRN